MNLDDFIKDLAEGRRRRRKRKRCEQQEEEAEPQGHRTDPAHSHPDHTSVLFAAAAGKLDPPTPTCNSGCSRRGLGLQGQEAGSAA